MKSGGRPTQREININKKRRFILGWIQKNPIPHADYVGREREQRIYKLLNSLIEGEDKSHGIVGYAPSGRLSDADLEGIDVFISYKKDKQNQVKILRVGICGPHFINRDKILYPNIIHIPVDATYSDEYLRSLIISKIRELS